jgi:Sigma-70, region 4
VGFLRAPRARSALPSRPGSGPARWTTRCGTGGVWTGLPREQRESYLLQLEGDFTVQEIAAITNCAAEMAQARLHHARSKLRELLSE